MQWEPFDFSLLFFPLIISYILSDEENKLQSFRATAESRTYIISIWTMDLIFN